MNLTKLETEFLRDVMGLVMPVPGEDGEITEGNISSSLAEATNRDKIEKSLWDKVVLACKDLNVVVGAAAPSFAVSAANVPAMHVYSLKN